MAKLGWVTATRKIEEKVESLRSFFEVARLGILDDLRVPGIAYRKAGKMRKVIMHLPLGAAKSAARRSKHTYIGNKH